MKVNQINFLTLLKLAAISRKEKIICRYSQKIINIVFFLYAEGIIQSFFFKKTKLVVFLKSFINYLNPLRGLKILSKPSFKRSIKYNMICRLKTDKRCFAISTREGVVNLMFCKRYFLGGQLLFIC